MFKKFFLHLLLSVFLMFIFTSCVITTNINNTDNNKINIVCSIFPGYDYARKIVGDKGNITILTKMGTDPHTYEPTPLDIKTIKNADIFIIIGGKQDFWQSISEKNIDEKDNTRVLTFFEAVENSLLQEELKEGMQTDNEHNSHSEHDAHTHDTDEHDHDTDKEFDEHVWLSPKNAIAITKSINSALAEISPEDKDFFEENTKNFVNELLKLDTDIKDTLSKAEKRTVIFADRFPFLYFFKEYNLDYYAAFPGCSAETDASAATITFINKKVKELDIKYIYRIENGTSAIATTISSETGADILVLNAIHTLSQDELSEGKDYLSLMYQNLENLKIGLDIL